MNLKKFISVSDIIEQSGGAMTWDKISDASRATVTITLGGASKHGIGISRPDIPEISSARSGDDIILKFDCIPSRYGDKYFSREVYHDFLSTMIEIKPTGCSDGNIHFITDIKFQNYDSSYLIDAHSEFDYNPCKLI